MVNGYPEQPGFEILHLPPVMPEHRHKHILADILRIRLLLKHIQAGLIHIFFVGFE
ncbi:hypothetical protein D3C75_1305040 [compost metagenome]